MHPFFKNDPVLLQHIPELFLYFSAITYKHIPALLLPQQGSANTAFSGAQYHQLLFVSLHYY